jgi:hypothetical protein
LKFARNYVFVRTGRKWMYSDRLTPMEWLKVAFSFVVWASMLFAVLYLLLIEQLVLAAFIFFVLFNAWAALAVYESLQSMSPKDSKQNASVYLKDFVMAALALPFIVYALHKYY